MQLNIVFTNIKPDLCGNMVPLGYNELIIVVHICSIKPNSDFCWVPEDI